MNWTQLRILLWLRWRLTRNQMARGGVLNAVLAMMVSLGAILIGLVGALGGLWAGAGPLAKATPGVLLIWWDASVGVFLLVWILGLVTMIERSEMIDVGRLLHLPVSLKGVFFANYAASHATLSLVVFVPGMLGLAGGLALGRGPAFLLLFPLVLSFFFMITAWTYRFRGWLVTQMVNPRRRRAIIAGMMLFGMLLGLAPNLALNVFKLDRGSLPAASAGPVSGDEGSKTGKRTAYRSAPVVQLTHRVVPALWLPEGAASLAEGRRWPAVLGTVGGMVVGLAGLWRGYVATQRFYTASSRTRRARSRRRPQDVGQAGWLEWNVPWIPSSAAAVALASLRSLSRAPEVKMSLTGSAVMTMVFAALVFTRGSNPPSDASSVFLPTAAVVLTTFSLIQFFLNAFGFDREGFRVWVLSPVPRRWILLGKNLATVPLTLLMTAAILLLLAVLARLRLDLVLAGVFQWLAAWCLCQMVGNLASILVPYRIAHGSLKPTKMPLKASFLLVIAHLIFPVAMAPVVLPAVGEYLSALWGVTAGRPVSLILSVALAVAVLPIYWFSLRPLGRLLERREQRILSAVTEAVE